MPNALWAGRDLYCVTPAVTRVLGFSDLIRTTAPFNRHVRQAKWCQGPILTRIPAVVLVFRYIGI